MRKFCRRLSALFHRRRLQRELAEEMAAHRDMMPADRRRNFGSTLRFQEEAGDQWGWNWLDQFRQDLAYGVRSLGRSPGFTLTAIAVLSIGIGVNLAEAHVFNAFLHYRFEVRDIDSLGQFSRVSPRGMSSEFSLPELEFYRRNNTALSAVIAEMHVWDVHHAQDSVSLRAVLVSGNYFAELGVTPLYGRMLDDRDDKPGAPPGAVLNYDCWQAHFGGDPGIVGKTIQLNDNPVQVVGIASSFGGIGWRGDFWLTISQYSYLTGNSESVLADPGTRPIDMFGRLKPGVSFEAAEAQFRPLTAELRRQQPEYVDPRDWLKIASLTPSVPTDPASVLGLTTFIVLVLLVLFSACANLGNMLLARGLARQREIEIRLAVGAGRLRLIRQLMTENLLLAALASVASLFVGRLAALLLWRITGAPSNVRLVTDWRIVLACAALGLGATLFFGLAPAVQVVKGGPKATRARKILVSVQVAASCVLLILSSFFARAIEQGFHAAVAADYSRMALVDPSFYLHRTTPSQARRTAGDITARLRQVPGVEAASVVAFPPILHPRIAHASGQQFSVSEVDPSYFSTMRLPVLLGRIFGPADPDAVVLSESAVRRLWPDQSPLGKSLRLVQRDRTVTGVVGDSGANLVASPKSVEAYLPLSDPGAPFSTILVRTTQKAALMSATVQSAATLPGAHPLVFTFDGLIDLRLESIRKMVRVIGSLAAIASVLALIGIFGLLAFTVAQRTREIGVRMALGARSADILRIVLGQYALPFGIGAVCGVLVAAAAATIMRKTVYGFIQFEVLSFGAGLLLFAAVALLASIAPARRALRIDPSSALRYE
jgi:predicted permease